MKKDEHRTSNIERPTSNEKQKKWRWEDNSSKFPLTRGADAKQAGCVKIGVGGRRPEVRGQKSEVRGQRPEVRGQRFLQVSSFDLNR